MIFLEHKKWPRLALRRITKAVGFKGAISLTALMRLPINSTPNLTRYRHLAGMRISRFGNKLTKLIPFLLPLKNENEH
jgi:hypothetical protein